MKVYALVILMSIIKFPSEREQQTEGGGSRALVTQFLADWWASVLGQLLVQDQRAGAVCHCRGRPHPCNLWLSLSCPGLLDTTPSTVLWMGIACSTMWPWLPATLNRSMAFRGQQQAGGEDVIGVAWGRVAWTGCFPQMHLDPFTQCSPLSCSQGPYRGLGCAPWSRNTVHL